MSPSRVIKKNSVSAQLGGESSFIRPEGETIKTQRVSEDYLSEQFQEMLDSVGIRLPKYKVREMAISLKKDGTITDDVINKLSFVAVCRVDR